MKKTIAVFLAFVLALSLCSCGSKSDYSYIDNENGITVTSYTGDDKEITLPKKIDGKTVTAIGEYAFNAATITSVEIPEGIFLGSYAFAECSTLEKAVLDDSITAIPDGFFAGCTSLTELTANSVTSVGFDAFRNSGLLNDSENEFVTINDGVLIGWKGSGNNVTVPETVKNIGVVFAGNSDIRTLYIPDTVTTVEDYAFDRCIGLIDITLPSTLKSIGESAFRQCYNLMSVEIPSGCESIGAMAFMSCSQLTDITIPDTVTVLGENVFYNSSVVTVIAPLESVAFTYAVNNGVNVQQ